MSELSKIPAHMRGLGVAIQHDYYESFRFSQGSPPLQRPLFAVLGAEYRAKCYGSLPSDLDKLLEYLYDAAPQLALPRGHITVKPQVIAEEFTTQWRYFRTCLIASDDKKITKSRMIAKGSELYAANLREINMQVTDRDLLHCDEQYAREKSMNRQKRGVKIDGRVDPCTSYYREHVLRGRKNGSKAFDTIFTAMLTQATPRAENRLVSLHSAWEDGHPGQVFYDQAARTRVSQFAPAMARQLGVLCNHDW